MRSVVLLFSVVVCSVFLLAATITEPVTKVEFPDTLTIGDVKMACTGVDLRTKFFMKIYAVAHYGDPAAWPTETAPAARLQYWRNADTAKAFVLTFTYDVGAAKIREAWNEGLNNANYAGTNRETLLNIFQEDLKKGDQLRFIALPGSALRAEQNGKSLGTIQDAALIKAVWAIWMGDKSVAENKENLVSRANP